MFNNFVPPKRTERESDGPSFGMLLCTSGKDGFGMRGSDFGLVHNMQQQQQQFSNPLPAISDSVKNQNYELALTQLNDAINENNDPILYYHRSVVFGYLNRWDESFSDAGRA